MTEVAAAPPAAGRGILLMVASMAFLTVTDTITKWLVTTLPVGEIIPLRAALALLGLILLATVWQGKNLLARHNLPGQLFCAILVAPFKYTAIFWAVLAGLVIWGERPDQWDLAGSALIVASGLYILYREQLANRQHRRMEAQS